MVKDQEKTETLIQKTKISIGKSPNINSDYVDNILQVNLMIVFTEHARDKLEKEMKKFGVTEKTAKQIVNKPDEMLFDALMNRFVAISWSRNLAVIYEKTDHDLVVVTVIYSTQLKDIVDRRRRTGRWM